MANLCKGGCGKLLPATNKGGFAWGHKNGCPTVPSPETALAVLGQDEAEVEYVPMVALELSEFQLEAIWRALPIEVKGAAILTALNCERE